jgi:peptidoglycan hydrolase CwlO-like protein
MTDSKNGNGKLKRLYWIIGIIALLAGMAFGADQALDKKIAQHPSIISVQRCQESMEKQLDKMDKKLDDIMDEMRRSKRKP